MKKKSKKPSLTDYLTDSADGGPIGGSEAEAFIPDAKAKKAAVKADRKAKKAARKAERRRKRTVRRHEDAILYSPEQMKGFPFSIILGYLFRFFSIAFSIFGIMVLFADSFLTVKLNYGWLLLYSTVCVTAFSLIFIGKKLILAGIGLLGGAVGLLTFLFGSPLSFYLGGSVALFNHMMDRLQEAGFAAAPHLNAAFGLPNVPSDQYLTVQLYGGMFLLITLLSLVFSAFSAKRTRLFPMLLLGGGLCTVCFTYNLCQSNFGIACVLSGLCSAIVLSTYDKIYAAHKKSRKSRSYSGFSSALAGLLAFAVLLAPASSIENPWRSIDLIGNPMSDLRMLVTTVLTGGNPRFNVMNSLIRERDASLQSVEFDEIPLFTVSSYSRRANVYLRSWIADDYDYENDSWSVLSDDDYTDMQNSLRGSTSGLTGDQINYQLALLFNQWLNADALPANTLTGSSDLGYYFSYVDVSYTGNTGQLYVLPSSFIPSLGLYQYGSRTDRYKEAFNRYSDGIYRSSWSNLRKSYTAGALIPSYLNSNFAQTAEERARAFTALSEFFDSSYLTTLDDEQIQREYANALTQAGLDQSMQAPLQGYLDALHNENWRSWRIQNFTNVLQYSEYVKSKYLEYPTESEGIREISELIRPDFEAAETTYDKIMSVVNYMILNYRYTTDPTVPENPDSSNLDAFLLETKDGYCVQFASAAALLLRSLGIPARYVQGYIAADHLETVDSEGHPNYSSVVRDSNAHAWIEVWMDGLGWRTFEVTPGYYQALYYIPTVPPDTNGEVQKNPIVEIVTQTSPEQTLPQTPETQPEQTTQPPVTTEPENSSTNEPGGFTFDPVVFLTAVGILIGAAGIALLIFWRIRKAKKIAAGRKYFIERAIFGNFEDQADLDLVSGTLVDGIYAIMKIVGKAPKLGETPVEFAYRVDHPPKPENRSQEKAIRRQLLWAHTFTQVTAILEKREFGGQIDRAELAVLGEFLESIERLEYPALPFYKKLYHRYIRCRI